MLKPIRMIYTLLLWRHWVQTIKHKKLNTMQTNSRFPLLKPSVFLFLALAFFSACQKEDPAPGTEDPKVEEPAVSLEKKILSYYAPFKYIVINEAKRQIMVYVTDDPEVFAPSIEVSEGVSILPASGTPVDEAKPPVYTLTAKDGSKTTYEMIICRVEWEYMESTGGGFLITRMGHFKEPWTAVVENGILTLHFGKSTESSLDLYLNAPNSATSTNSIGNHTPPNIPAGKAGVLFVYRENGVNKTFNAPLGGKLNVTKYDAVKKTISGNFSQIKYNGISNSAQGSTTLSGSFENLPVETK